MVGVILILNAYESKKLYTTCSKNDLYFWSWQDDCFKSRKFRIGLVRTHKLLDPKMLFQKTTIIELVKRFIIDATTIDPKCQSECL